MQGNLVYEVVNGSPVEVDLHSIPKPATPGWRLFYVNSGTATENAEAVRGVLNGIQKPESAKISFLGDGKTVYVWWFDPAN